ncbi:MAG: S8 family serine peptidase [Flavobacteriales bacterium]
MRNGMLLLFVALFAAAAPAVAQHREKIDFPLRAFLERDHAPGDQVDLFIHGSASAVSAAVHANGGFVKMSMGRLVSARVPVSRVRDLAASSAVESFEFRMDPLKELADSMRVKARVNEVHAGLAPLPQAYDGTGVVVGIIDTGLDYEHGDFKNEDGTTRVAWYWDQGEVGSTSPPDFGYGGEWTAAQIDAGQITVTDHGTHGTNSTGIAAGNGLAGGHNKGVAPGADIIVVAVGNESEGDHAMIVDGVKYIFDRAAAMGKPAVVNISLGSYGGSHDGKDAAALLIDSLINAQRGRALVCAGGNAGNYYPLHLHTDVGSDTLFTWFTTNANGAPYNFFPYPNLYFELWADAADLANVQYAIGADRVQPSLAYRGRTAFNTVAANIGNVITEPLMSLDGNLLGTVQYFAQQRGDQIQLQVLMASPDSAAYNWRLMTTGSGSFDVWSITTLTATSNMLGPVLAGDLGLPFPTVAQYPDMVDYVQPDLSSHIVDSWACSDMTFTVANYNNRTEYLAYDDSTVQMGIVPWAISAASSAGPTRDFRVKPDIAAPGDITMTAGAIVNLQWAIDNEPWKVDECGWHARNGGTSIASPVVAGAVALYLEKCPNASWGQIRQAFLNTAWGDALTGTLPNDRFGYGRVHAFNALVTSNMPDIAISGSDDEMCANEAVQVTAPAGYDAYLWSNGSTDNPTTYTGTGPLTVVASTATGCAHSNGLTFTLFPLPPTPVITAVGTELTSSVGPSYQWYLDGGLIGGANGQVYVAPVSGSYTVVITDANGCAAESAPEAVVITGIADAAVQGFSIWPSPATDLITIRTPANGSGAVRITATDARGRVVIDQQETSGGSIIVPLRGVAAGTYALRVRQGDARWETGFVKLP